MNLELENTTFGIYRYSRSICTELEATISQDKQPSHHCGRILELEASLLSDGAQSVSFTWIPDHSGVASNEEVYRIAAFGIEAPNCFVMPWTVTFMRNEQNCRLKLIFLEHSERSVSPSMISKDYRNQSSFKKLSKLLDFITGIYRL